jgi:hypothetical protein
MRGSSLIPTRSITSSCYRVYFAEFMRKSRPTRGVLPGLACALILNQGITFPNLFLPTLPRR